MGERRTVHQCLGCGKLCGDRDGWEAHQKRGLAGWHPDDYRWGLVEVVPAEHADALVEAVERFKAAHEAVPLGSGPTGELTWTKARQELIEALARYRQASHASTGKDR